MTDGGRDRLTLEPLTPDPQVGLLLTALRDSRRRTLRELEGVTDAMVAWQSPPPPAWTLHHLLQHEAEHRAHVALVRDLYLAAAAQ